MELAAAAVAVLASAVVVLRDITRSQRVARRGPDVPASARGPIGPPPPEPVPPLPPPAPARRVPSSAPARTPTARPARPGRREPGAPAAEAAPASVLGAFRYTEPDRRTRPMRRTTSALLLALVTVTIATGVGGMIYLGLRRLG